MTKAEVEATFGALAGMERTSVPFTEWFGEHPHVTYARWLDDYQRRHPEATTQDAYGVWLRMWAATPE